MALTSTGHTFALCSPKRPSGSRTWPGSTSAGRTCLFILHGNIHDRIWYQDAAHLLPAFLQKVVFRRRQTVFSYNRAAGITFRDSEGQQAFVSFLRGEGLRQLPDVLTQAFPFASVSLHEIGQGRRVALPVSEYADTIVPQSPAGHYGPEGRAALLYLAPGAGNPLPFESDLTIVLLAESLSELHPKLVQTPMSVPFVFLTPDLPARQAFYMLSPAGPTSQPTSPPHAPNARLCFGRPLPRPNRQNPRRSSRNPHPLDRHPSLRTKESPD